jgi:hypothetical protein
MILIPIPQGLDAANYPEGESFEITATVVRGPNGFEVEAIEGMPVESEEAMEDEAMEAETEMDEAGLAQAMGRGMMGA